MHSFTDGDKKVSFAYNGDLSGTVIISGEGIEIIGDDGQPIVGDRRRVEIPMTSLLEFVGGRMRGKHVERIEQLSGAQYLDLLTPPEP